MTEEKKFDFNQIGSILLKLKIVDWYSSILENNFTPKIYMGKDLQVNKKDQFQQTFTLSIVPNNISKMTRF